MFLFCMSLSLLECTDCFFLFLRFLESFSLIFFFKVCGVYRFLFPISEYCHGKGGRRGCISIWEGQQVVSVKQQYNFTAGMVFKEWTIRIAVLCFDDQLCCILTQCMSGFCGAPSGK